MVLWLWLEASFESAYEMILIPENNVAYDPLI